MYSISDKYAHFVNCFNIDNIPVEVVEKVKVCLLDTISVAIAGSLSEEAQIVKGVITSLGGKEEAKIIGDEKRIPAPNAALINATMAHAIELDDTDRFTYYHPGAPIIMAALAAGEKVGCTGKTLLEGIITGYELSIRIAESVNPSHRRRGFHTTGTVGTFGAGIAVAKILGLTEAETVNAIGICGTQAAGLFEFLQDGSMTKRIHPGKSAWNGILAAYLAQAGFTGPSTILEGEHGFLTATSDNPDISKLTNGLGTEYRIMRIGIKRHAACRYCHTPIDAALNLKGKKDISFRDINSVEVYVSKMCAEQTSKSGSATLMEAQLSTPYGVALALVKGRTGIDAYKEGLNDTEVISLMNRVKVNTDADIDYYGRQALLRLGMIDGRNLESKVELPKGEPENPLSIEEIKEKCWTLCLDILGQDKTNKLFKNIEKIDTRGNVDFL